MMLVLASVNTSLHNWAHHAAGIFEHRFASVGEIGGLPIVLELVQVIGAILIYLS